MTTPGVSASRWHIGRLKPLEILLGLLLLEVAVAFIITGIRIVIIGHSSSLVDDAYIPLRYADNAARGFGLVWNPGGPRVQGFTSLTYVFLLLAIQSTGASSLLAVPLIGAAFSAVILALALLLFRRINPGRPVDNLFGAILLGLSPQLWFWSKAGLETTLFTALLLAAVLAYLAQRVNAFPSWGTGLLFALCALTRPEGAFFFAATLAFDAILAFRADRRRLRLTLAMLAGWIALYAPVFLWQWSYFGQPLPNTFQDKTGAGWLQIRGGFRYLLASLGDILRRSALPLLASLLILRRRGQPTYLLLLVAVGLLVTVAEGGDHFPMARFLLPVLPLLFALGTVGLSEVAQRTQALPRLLVYAVLLAAAIVGFQPRTSLAVLPADHKLPPADASHFEYMQDFLPGYVVMGRTLASIAAPGRSIAVVPIGAIGYFSGMQVIDMVGLTDPYIARQPFDLQYASTWRPGHDKGDGLYVLGLHPDYIQLVDRLTSQPLAGVDDFGRQYKSVVEIWQATEFHQAYEFAPIQLQGGWYYNLYRRRIPAP